ncbi:rod-binding protein [uncultured Thioclava sp.]|mgnify:CR=1 FL=1|uniref:Rod-binding protein n=1 Tax=Thioclava arctica TaxID=3238301 RepID=A0ABV3TJI8_9RHOB|nr:rod-binding protein [uncultured Thioclava sp.]
MTPTQPITQPAPPQPAPPTQHEAEMREAAVKLEANFLAEMLKHAGLGDTEGAFSGGVGEEQFSSFLRQEQSQLMAEAGGIGLAETIFEAMKAREAKNGSN